MTHHHGAEAHHVTLGKRGMAPGRPRRGHDGDPVLGFGQEASADQSKAPKTEWGQAK